ncbi:hypothetical protein Acy02nite_83690 [Actinoplanes cyaneus]|uniref:Glycosyltransferase subfamily 4-like N-terminal domain-containing protein n=1 Tax=Actinoplanes cyaneus TaxID=52696 RepID=A0A919IS84_9ACTN|nr:glycosyltransferase family 4 protein [Actinoplanes cyaneus]MCW2138217.1 Glycosyltransferase involved in cell wall bisynthesis [Actinoplanes cyaneus]GID70488.1 hypothetical protein Acy02nite_83690 [Actinoplanes cyaneus]
MNVLVAFEGYGNETAGAERMARRTTTALRDRGHRVAVLTRSPHPSAEAWPATAPGFRPDVVHAFDLARPDTVVEAGGIAERYGAGFVVTPCSTVEVWPDRERGSAVCRAADAVFALTDAEADDLRRLGVPASRIRPLPSAPDLTAAADPARFRRDFGVDGPIVLFLGRRMVSKGYRTLLSAAPLIWSRIPRATLMFAGPDSEPEAAQYFRDHADPRIVDLGTVGEQTKHDALAACDVLCLPSTADVFPLVFAEAWSCGRPVVTGDFPGADRVVRHGVDGLVVTPRPGPVAEALTGLLLDDARRTGMGRAGRRRAAREFGWDRVAESCTRAYREATGVRS